jgi:hypothetical protein
MLACAALVAGAVGASAGQALASREPFLKFAHCPLTNPLVQMCAYARSASGHAFPESIGVSELRVGTVVLPLAKPIVLQGGVEGLASPLFAPQDGTAAISVSPEVLPGGLKTLIAAEELTAPARSAYRTALRSQQREVLALIEPVAGPEPVLLNGFNLIGAHGVFLRLPVKLKLLNPLLGDDCYAGTDAEPVTLQLTDGTTEPPPPALPVSGAAGTARIGHDGILAIRRVSLVDNGFAAPGVHGCGSSTELQEQLDGAIDHKVGLPSPPGANSVRIDGTLSITSAAVTQAHLEP